jgi:hypothetical protein
MKSKKYIKYILYIFVLITVLVSFLISCQSSLVNTKVVEYNKKLNEYRDYYLKIQNLTINYSEKITEIADKINQSDDISEICDYYEMALNLFKNYYDEFAKLKMPSIANNFANYNAVFIQLQISRISNLIDYYNGDNPEYTLEKDSELLQKITDANLKTIQELKNINNYFNQEAEKLGLEKPFK